MVANIGAIVIVIVAAMMVDQIRCRRGEVPGPDGRVSLRFITRSLIEERVGGPLETVYPKTTFPAVTRMSSTDFGATWADRISRLAAGHAAGGVVSKPT